MDQISQLLTRRVEKIFPSKKELEQQLRTGKKLKLYLGIDPTYTRLHLGHTIPLRKLQEFADLGHEAILLFGTGTALAGDPSKRDTGRQLITQKEIADNIATWKAQVAPLVDFKKIKIVYNGDWLTKLSLKDLIYIGSKISAVQLFKRDNFTRRIKRGDTVWYHETLYPLLQGYDSVQMNVDLEIGGTDQTFNMLIGRELQKKINHKDKSVLTLKMIVGTDGQTMSKTSGNCVWLTDSPIDLYGKVMGLQDYLIGQYFEAFTDTPMAEIASLAKNLKAGHSHPLMLKKQLAFTITKQLKGQKAADTAQKEFEQVYQKRELPQSMPVFSIGKLTVNPISAVDLLVQTGQASSRSEAKRLLAQHGVTLNQQSLDDATVRLKAGDILKIGKRKWLKLR
jgi:tyrosyl-tRNA synthetase